jgi:putative SOS response-associated peptidase YedK
MTTNQEAIHQLFKVAVDNTGNLPSKPGIYPDYAAPIVRNSDARRELALTRWGMPTPAKFREGTKSDPRVTNVRNATSPHWRCRLGVESRCVVPFNSFAEPVNGTFGGRAPVWFAFGDIRPLTCFAGIWSRWTSVRKVKEGETTNDIFVFLTINPNADIEVFHPNAMPVILRTPEEVETWLTAPAAEALKLQRPLPDGTLRISWRTARKRTAGRVLRCPPASFYDRRRPTRDLRCLWVV